MQKIYNHMKTFGDLELNENYLIQENEGDDITLVEVLMETENAVFVEDSSDNYEIKYWRRKSDEIFDIIDKLTEEQLIEYLDASRDWEDMDMDDADFDFDEDDTEDEEAEEVK